MQKSLVDILLMPEVGRQHREVEGQLADIQITDMHKRAEHLLLVEMLVVDGLFDLLKDTGELVGLAARQLINSVIA